MKWWLFLICAAVLLVLCTFLAGPYQALLMRLTLGVLGIDDGQTSTMPADLSAANALALYGALCIATTRASWMQRWRAVAMGLPMLVVLEVASGVVAVKVAQSSPGLRSQIGQALLDAQRWCAVPLVWFVVIGRRALATGDRSRSASRASQHS